MTTYKIFPAEYDPVIAEGPPTADYELLGLTWTPADTEYHQQLATQAEIIETDTPPVGRWVTEQIS